MDLKLFVGRSAKLFKWFHGKVGQSVRLTRERSSVRTRVEPAVIWVLPPVPFVFRRKRYQKTSKHIEVNLSIWCSLNHLASMGIPEFELCARGLRVWWKPPMLSNRVRVPAGALTTFYCKSFAWSSWRATVSSIKHRKRHLSPLSDARVCGAVGSALDWRSKGPVFDPRRAHHTTE